MLRSIARKLRAELSIPLFSLQDETGRVLDVAATFAPKPRWPTTSIRIILLLWSLEVLHYDLTFAFKFPYFYFAFLSQWSFGLTIIYYFSFCVVSLGNYATQPKTLAAHPIPSFPVRFMWAMFSIAVMIQLIATFIFWVFYHHVFFHEIAPHVRYPCVMKHGVFLTFTLLEGLVHSRIPVRIKHYLFPAGVMYLYFFWTLFANFSSISNPFHTGVDPYIADDDVIYPQYNPKKRPVIAFLVYVASNVFIAPAFFLAMWAMSACTCTGPIDGSHRRHIGDRKGQRQHIISELDATSSSTVSEEAYPEWRHDTLRSRK